MMEGRFPRDIDALPSIFGFIAEFGTSQRIPEEQRFDVELIVEELFTNMVKYSADGAPEISIGLERGPGRLVITLRDFDVEPFDVTRPLNSSRNTGSEPPRAGGRGLHLVRQVADELHYEYRDRNSTITVTKRLDS